MHLVAPGTIDEDIYRALERREGFVRALRDKTASWPPVRPAGRTLTVDSPAHEDIQDVRLRERLKSHDGPNGSRLGSAWSWRTSSLAATGGAAFDLMAIGSRLYRADAVTNRWRFISDEDLEAELAHEAVRERWLWPDDGAGKPTRWRLFWRPRRRSTSKRRASGWRGCTAGATAIRSRQGLPTDAPWDLESNLAIQLSDKPMPRSALSLTGLPAAASSRRRIPGRLDNPG